MVPGGLHGSSQGSLMLKRVGNTLPIFAGTRWMIGWRQLGGGATLALMLMSCGSEEQQRRNNAAMDAQLAAANASIAQDDGREVAAPIGSADEAGQQMRAASAKPPHP
jgi:hypothetical protein